MPTRLIVAYVLILLMAAGLAAAVLVLTHEWRIRRRMRRRVSGHCTKGVYVHQP